MTIEYIACDSANVDPTTGVCSQPVYVMQPTLIPPLDTTTGVTLSIAVLACWAVAYGFKVLRRPGE